MLANAVYQLLFVLNTPTPSRASALLHWLASLMGRVYATQYAVRHPTPSRLKPVSLTARGPMVRRASAGKRPVGLPSTSLRQGCEDVGLVVQQNEHQ